MESVKPTLEPRKTPIQRRSERTVGDIHQAAIQDLVAHGMNNLTTTRVAERAGVSFGTLYQYYPNKQSLLAAVLERHLDKVLHALEKACNTARGGSLQEMADELVRAYLHGKFSAPEVSMALYAVSADQGAAATVARLVQRVQLAVCDLLASCPHAHFQDLKTTSFILTTSLIGPGQTLLTERAPRTAIERARVQLQSLAGAYLDRSSSRHPPSMKITVRTSVTLDDDLLEQARAFTGISDRSALVQLALNSLVESEAARRLAQLAGSEPHLKAAPRRRRRVADDSG